MSEDAAFDFFVIGAGSGGARAARVATALGARTAVAGPGALGGIRVNLGCIPKKYRGCAAALGARTAVTGSGALGGTCVNLGCIPKKRRGCAAAPEETQTGDRR